MKQWLKIKDVLVNMNNLSGVAVRKYEGEDNAYAILYLPGYNFTVELTREEAQVLNKFLKDFETAMHIPVAV